MWMTETVDFPFRRADPLNPQFNFERVSLSMTDERFWVGFFGLELNLFPNVTVYGELGGNIPKDATVRMDATGRALLPAPDNAQNMVSPWFWTAKNIHWWLAEGGVALWITKTLALDIGFRTEHIDYRLDDPRNLSQTSALGIAGGLAPGPAINCARI